MLQITMTAGAIYFNDLSDDMYNVLKKEYDLKENITRKGHHIEGAPQELYKTLLKLSYVYDIELS